MTARFSRRAALAGLTATALARPVRAQELAHQATPAATPLGPRVPPELVDRGGNWVTAQGDLAATRVATGSAIDSATVTKLEVAWSIPLDRASGYGAMTANPIAIGQTVFVQTMLSDVWAIDKATGAIHWRYDVGIPTIGPNGVAAGYGMVVATAGDTAEVFALDATSGRELWRVRLTNNPFEGIDSTPAILDNRVFISTVGGSYHGFNTGGARGVLFSLDAATGATLWQFDTTTNNLWGNPTVNSGGGLWYPPSFDDDGNCYFGTANPGPWPGTPEHPSGSSRPGPNDYACSLVCLEARTGVLRWHLNASPHDLFDHDFQNTPVLVDAEVDDAVRHLAIGSGKTGTVIATDRETGVEVWRARVGQHENDELSEVSAGQIVEVSPGAWGGVLTPIACDGVRIVAAVNNMPLAYGADGYDRAGMFDLVRGTGEIVALEVGSGRQIWSQPVATLTGSGATIVNDVVFAGGMDGTLLALDLESGRVLWSDRGPAGLNAPCAVAGDSLLVPFGGAWPGRTPGDATAPALIAYTIASR